MPNPQPLRIDRLFRYLYIIDWLEKIFADQVQNQDSVVSI